MLIDHDPLAMLRSLMNTDVSPVREPASPGPASPAPTPPHRASGTAAASERDVLDTAIRWLDAGHAVELVTVARTWGSSPRPPGSLAAVRGDGQLVGSVSGGCIEKQLVAAFAERSADEDAGTDDGTVPGSAAGVAIEMPRTATHEISDEEARRVGLTCGGRLELVFEHLDGSAGLAPIVRALDARRRLVRRFDVDTRRTTLAEAGPDDAFDWDGRVLTRVFGPDWRVLLVGAGELSRYVATFARTLDFDVIVVDPRAAFRETFDVAGVALVDLLPDEAVGQHAGDERSAVLALSHDPSLDDLALEEALARDCFHVAALGSRRSHAARRRRLAFLGVPERAMDRISAPAGLDIGSRTAAEIAVSIAAELVQARARARRAFAVETADTASPESRTNSVETMS